jgi:hypothetical protein
MAKKYTKRKSIRKSRTKKSKTKYRRRHRSNRKSSRKAIRVKLNTHRGGSGQKFTGNPFSRTAKYAWNPKHKTRRLNVEERAEKLGALGKKLTIQTLFEYTPFLVTTEDNKYRFHILEKLDSGREFDGYTNNYIDIDIDKFSDLGKCSEAVLAAQKEWADAAETKNDKSARLELEAEKNKREAEDTKKVDEEAAEKQKHSAALNRAIGAVDATTVGSPERKAAQNALLVTFAAAKGNVEAPVVDAVKTAMSS